MEGSLRSRCLRFIMACGWKLARHRFSFSGSLPSSVDRELACRWMLNGARQRALRRTGSTRTDGKRLVRRLTETVLSSRTSRALREQRRVSAERPRRWGGMVNSWTTLVTWAAPLPADTLSFEYQWLLDGSPVATTRTYSRVFNEESGTQHTLKSIVTLMDGTKDTVSKVVTVALAASVSGPSELDPDEVGAWQAVMHGARYPLTSCEWWIDTTPVPGSSCTLEYSWSTPSSSYVLSVVATDSRGYSATSIGHGIHIGAANCSPPDCYESMRGGAHTRRIAPRQKRPR